MADRFALKLKFDGGDAEQNRLEFYDATTSLHGFAQSLQIATHALINNEIIVRSTALKGAEIYVTAPRSGSVIFDIVTFVEAYPVTAAITAPVFYDFMRYVFSKAAGYINITPESSYVTKLNTKDEPFFDDLAETLEGSLQRGHRAIDNGVKSITLERPRSALVTFDHSSSEWVNTRDLNPAVQEIDGNVTRYNSITGNGRCYIGAVGRIVPFRLDQNFSAAKRGFLTWSLHGNTTSQPKELRFYAHKIESARGELKRIIIIDCNRLTTDE